MTSQQPIEYEELEPVAKIVKGDEQYANSVLETFGEFGLPRPWSVEQIARVVLGRAGLDLEKMRDRGWSRGRARARAITALLARKHCRIPLNEVSRFFHRDGTTLTKDCQRLEAELASRQDVDREIESIAAELDEAASRAAGVSPGLSASGQH